MTKIEQLRRHRDRANNELRALETIRGAITLDPESPEFKRERQLREQVQALDSVIAAFEEGSK